MSKKIVRQNRHSRKTTKPTPSPLVEAAQRKLDEINARRVAIAEVLAKIISGNSESPTPLAPDSPEWRLASEVRDRIERAQRAGAPSEDQKIQSMSGEQLATRALEGYGDGPIGYAALCTLSGELDVLCDATDDPPIKAALFAMSNRARIAAELDRRAANNTDAAP